MVRTFSIASGIFLLLLAFISFLPSFVVHGKLCGIFRVNLEHKVAQLASGSLAILCGCSGKSASKKYLIYAGFIYLLFAFYGLAYNGLVLKMIAVNPADGLLFAILSLLFLFTGFKN